MSGNRSNWHFPPDQLAILMLQFGVPIIGILAGCFLPAVSAARHEGNPILFWVAILLSLAGIVLLFFARLPLYRQGKFWTFGPAGLPERNRRLYRSAWSFIGTSLFILAVLVWSVKDWREGNGNGIGGKMSNWAMVRSHGVDPKSCTRQLKTIGLAIYRHAEDHEGALLAYLSELAPYLGGDTNAKAFFCYSRNRSIKGEPPTRISEVSVSPQYIGFDYLSVTSVIPGVAANETLIPVMCDRPGNHQDPKGITILFRDGHVSWWPGTIEEYAVSNSLVITVNTNWLR